MLLLLLNMGVIDAAQAQAHPKQTHRLSATQVWKERLTGLRAKKGSDKELRAKIRVELHHMAGSLPAGRALLAQGRHIIKQIEHQDQNQNAAHLYKHQLEEEAFKKEQAHLSSEIDEMQAKVTEMENLVKEGEALLNNHEAKTVDLSALLEKLNNLYASHTMMRRELDHQEKEVVKHWTGADYRGQSKRVGRTAIGLRYDIHRFDQMQLVQKRAEKLIYSKKLEAEKDRKAKLLAHETKMKEDREANAAGSAPAIPHTK